ncbi:cupin-like domain-containing protein [Herbaspirillum sp. DW155]|uniref:JmjC domain-containing protein n=1 Tax=Herbaspirillum sp. DW155 TaxID=3095609 RepID=UPI00308CC085|nr:cupin-like domain-containing protein [Herbaspirillum sp. DW155]
MCIDFGMSRADFRAVYQEKKPLLVRGAVSPGSFTWRDVNALFERCNVAEDSFKLAYDGIRPKQEYVERYLDVGTPRYRLIKPVVYAYMRKGATLIANKIKHEPKVSAFARAVGEFTGRQVVSSAYTAFGQRSSFRCHWDTRDVFAIQLIGRKRWLIYPPSLESPLHTQQSKHYEDRYPCPSEPCMDIVLEPGDVFYLPRGWWHDPLPVGEGCFHLAIGTFPAYAADYLEWSVRQMHASLEVRRSLERWEEDQQLLADIGPLFSTFIQSPENYQRFMEQFHAASRDEAALALEHFGDPGADSINEQASLHLRAHSSYGLEQDYLMHDGHKMKFHPCIADLIRMIRESPGLQVRTLLERSGFEDRQLLRDLLTQLCRQEVVFVSDA